MCGICCNLAVWQKIVVCSAGSIALFLAGMLAGMKVGGGRRGSSGSGGGSRSNGPVRSPDLYIGNLDESVTGEELQRQFGKFGDVKEVRMVPPRNGETKTFSFITMGSIESAQAAMTGLNGRDIGGLKIVVSEARSRRGGGGGGNGARRGRR